MTPFTRAYYIDAITNALSYLKSQVELNNAINKYSINIEAEDFYAGFLNVVFGFRLKNANYAEKNVASIDLYEEHRREDGQRVAVQVTSKNDAENIKKTLNSFSKYEYQEDYTRLIILMITTKKEYRTRFSFTGESRIEFDQKRDILDVKDLQDYISSIADTDHIERIYEYLNKELPTMFLILNGEDDTNSFSPKDTELFNRLMSVFSNNRKTHPSIRMMDPDPNLFPKGLPEIKSDNRLAVVNEESPRAIKEMILDSWKHDDKRHILLVGEGGIGKTVAMLTLPQEEWFRQYRIPVIYVPLQRLDAYEGRLNSYLREKFGADYDRIIELANRDPEGHPRLLLLLDGFNEIPDKYKQTAERLIKEWMGRAGVQIITTSRLGFALENSFLKYQLQTLPQKTVESFLVSAGIKKEHLPQEKDPIWKVIDVPLMLTLYTRIDKVKEIADRTSAAKLLDWREADNAAHIIWNYLQTELYRCIDKAGTSYSPMQYVTAILLVAPYVCCQMSRKMKFYIDQEEMQGLIREALSFYDGRQNLVSQQFLNLREEYDHFSMENVFNEDKADNYTQILVENIALFQKQKTSGENGRIKNIYSLMHKNFRDALVAFFISLCLPGSSDSSEKTLLLDYADYYVKNYIAEFLSDEELVAVWEQHRKEDPEDGHITFILMDIIGRQRRYDYRELDFSGLDLTKTSLHRLLSRRLDICPLPENRNRFVHTKISLNSISPNGRIAIATGVTYSSDGRHLASGSSDSMVRIWDLESGESRVLSGHTDGVTSVANSPDGRHLASGSDDSTVRIWDLESGESRVLAGHTGGINSVAYSPDGRYLVSGSDDNTARIWDINSGESLVLAGNRGEVNSVVYSPDGRCLASGSNDNTVRIWDLNSGESRVLLGHTGGVNSVAYSIDNRHLASRSNDNTIRIWDLESGESRVLDDHIGGGNSIAYGPDGRHLASESNDNTVRIWNLDSGESRVLAGHTGGVNSIAYSPDGKQLASGADDCTVWIWDLEKDRAVCKYAIIPNLNLSGANFELADINDEDKEILKAAGAKLQYQLHFDTKPSVASIIRNQIEDFFKQDPEGYCNVDAFLGFIRKNDTDSMRKIISKELHYLFQISETDNIFVPVHQDPSLQLLLYQIWVIDTQQLKEQKGAIKPEDIPSQDYQVTKEQQEHQEQQGQDNNVKLQKDQKQDSDKSNPKTLEKATLRVVERFQIWIEKKLGERCTITKQAEIQDSGEQNGYDVGLELTIDDSKYKLGFECKYYTSNIREGKKSRNINIRDYATNLLKYIFNSKKTDKVNNRWVLVNPFGDLQNDYLDYFVEWNIDNNYNNYLKIFAITETQSKPTCKDFFSVDEDAYKMVYHNDPTTNKEDKKDTVFSYIYETIIDKDYVERKFNETLYQYGIPEKFICEQLSSLLSVRTGDDHIALDAIFDCLTEIHSNTKSTSRKNGIYIIGEYGTGKSWLLYQTMAKLIKHLDEYHFVPVLMELKNVLVELKELYIFDVGEYSIESIVERYVVSFLENRGQFKDKLTPNRRLVFLLDGFDEVMSGLSSTNNKIRILRSLIEKLESMYKNYNPAFIVTSRESDFHACQTNKDFDNLFDQFYKISLVDCSENEAKTKLLKYFENTDFNKEAIVSVAENQSILKLARRPVFFELLIQLLRKRKEPLENVVDEFSLLDRVISDEIDRAIDELKKAKRIESIAEGALRQSLLEALLNCAIDSTKNNGNEAPISFSRKELVEIIPNGVVTIENEAAKEPWTFKADRNNKIRVTFQHNIVREFLVAKKFFILIEKCVSGEIEEQEFFNLLRSVQMSPASLRFFLIFVQKREQENAQEEIKEKIKYWLCKSEIKNDDSELSAKLLEILLQPGSIFGGNEKELLDLSGIHADNLCIWNCKLKHLNLRGACLRNMQMTDTQLYNVDLREANLTGLRFAPNKPIIDICLFRKNTDWHLAVLYQDGQVLEYSFTDYFMQDQYSVKLLQQFEDASGLFAVKDTLYIIVSGKTIYPLEDKNKYTDALYSMSSGKSIQRIIPDGKPDGKRNRILVLNGKDYWAQVIDKESLISHNLDITKSGNFYLTKDGMLVLVSGNEMKLISQTGSPKTLCEWESNYECFTILQRSNGENNIYIKADDCLIQVIWDEQFNNKTTRTEYQIDEICGTIREIRVIKDGILAGISDTDLYIMTIKENIVKVEKLKTAVEASRVLLGNETEKDQMKDQEAYELLSGSIIPNEETGISG